MSSHIMPTYNRLPVTFVRGEGCWLWDEQGRRYLDALAGVAVCSLGHAHPVLAAAIADQCAQLIHTSNHYGIAYQEKLGDKLGAKSGMDTAFFCNSGAEANEAAIKLARRYGHSRGIDTPAIIVMANSFHGRTLAALSATGNSKIQQGFEPLVEGFIRAPYNDVAAVAEILASNSTIAAILVEPVQGEGGVNVPAPEYLNQLRELCDRHQALLMLDEIQTGIGRTGKFLACQHNGILPDVVTLAKALGNGVPIGACLARGKAANLLTAGSHGSTFGGNPLACRAALTVLDILEQDSIIDTVEQKAQAIAGGLAERLKNTAQVVDIRYKGLMIGIEIDRPCADLVKQALGHGLLINVTADKTIRLLPPLIISDEEITQLIDTLSALIVDFCRSFESAQAPAAASV